MKIAFMVSILLLLGGTISSHADTEKWKNEPGTFRGVPFGATEADVLKIIPGMNCNDTKSGRSCYDTNHTIGKIKTGCLLTFNKGKFSGVYIVFHSDDYNNVKSELIETYGEPMKSVDYDIKTRAGISQKNNKLLWYGDKLIVSVQKYCGDLHNGCANYMQRSALTLLPEEHGKEKK